MMNTDQKDYDRGMAAFRAGEPQGQGNSWYFNRGYLDAQIVGDAERFQSLVESGKSEAEACAIIWPDFKP